MLDDRKLAVLRAIVEDFVRTHEPVGSKGIVERHQLGVSPATIRNDMAVLEDEGYIAQPHTSAGRIPTDQGYRLFVDRLSQVKPLTPAERRAIENFLAGAVDLDDVMGRAVRLLAQLTRQVALVQYPSLMTSSVRHVELVALSEHRLLVVLIADTGRIEQRMVTLPEPLADDVLADLRSELNAAVGGRAFTAVADRLAELPERFAAEDRANVSIVLATLLESVVVRHEERIVLGGTAEPHPLPRRLRRTAAGAGGARGADGAAAAARGDPRGHRVRDDRAREHRRRHGQHLRRDGRLWPAPWNPGTLGRRRPDPHGLPEHDGLGPGGRPVPGRPAGERIGTQWPTTTTPPLGWLAMHLPRRSSGHTAGSRASCIPTSTPTR